MDEDIKNIFSDLGMITQVGMVVVICLAIGLVLGILAEKWLSWGPVIKIAGVILGLTAGVWQAYRIISEKID